MADEARISGIGYKIVASVIFENAFGYNAGGVSESAGLVVVSVGME